MKKFLMPAVVILAVFFSLMYVSGQLGEITALYRRF
jgi:hypothetical protein